MQLQPVTRKQSNLRLAIVGACGTGKTVSALLTAYGLCGQWAKIAVIDTEHNAASYHSYLGKFNSLQIGAPYSPEKMERAINLCEEAGIEVIIIDSLSTAWVGEGGVLDLYNSTPGSDTDKYREAMAQHYQLKGAILESSAHIIVTIRCKKEYPFKMLQDEQLVYDFMTVVQLDDHARIRVIKDQTTLLICDDPCTLHPEIGQHLAAWCNQGENPVSPDLLERIDKCQTHEELTELFHDVPLSDAALVNAFTKRRQQLDKKNSNRSRPAMIRSIGELPDQTA